MVGSRFQPAASAVREGDGVPASRRSDDNRLVLGIDNSIDFLNLALALEDSLIEERTIKGALTPSQVLPGHVSAMLAGHGYAIKDLSFVAVTLGPGSFTGMRVALAFAEGMSAGAGIPVVGVPTLDVLASPFSFMLREQYVLPLIDAKKGEVFCALYRSAQGSMERLTDYKALKPKDVPTITKSPCLCFGTGARLCQEYLSPVPEVTIMNDSFSRVSGEMLIKEALKRAGGVASHTIQPIYGRRSEAEIRFNITVT